MMKVIETPASWENTTIDAIADYIRGITYKKEQSSNSRKPNMLPVLRANNIASSLVYDDLVFVEKKLVKAEQEICAGDIVFAMSSGSKKHVGKSALATQNYNGTFGAFCGLLRPVDDMNKRFLAYYFSCREFRYYIERISKGTNINNLKREHLLKYDIALPPLNEQRRIVAKIEELFSELDKGVESLNTAREQLKTYRQAVLKHAFEGKLTAEWREENKDKLEPAEKLLERIENPDQPKGGRKASIEVIEGVAALAVNIPSKEPPTSWKWVPLLRIARQETGHTPSRKHSNYWGGKNLWIGIADARLHHGRVVHDTIQKVTNLGLDNSSARTLPAKTVCLSRTASVGYVCIMGLPMATSQDFATWSCTKALEPKFLMYALMAEGDEIRRFGKGTTHTTIYFPEIRALHICLPPITEQEIIVENVEIKLQELDNLENEINIQLKKSEALRQSILKKAFSGQLVPQDPGDLPAPRPGKWFVYVLECEDGSLYKGHSRDVLERWKQHATGRGAEWTKKHPPVRLAHWETFNSKEKAIEREKELKTGYGRKWLDREIKAGRTRQAGEPASVLLERIRAEKQARGKTQEKNKKGKTAA